MKRIFVSIVGVLFLMNLLPSCGGGGGENGGEKETISKMGTALEISAGDFVDKTKENQFNKVDGKFTVNSVAKDVYVRWPIYGLADNITFMVIIEGEKSDGSSLKIQIKSAGTEKTGFVKYASQTDPPFGSSLNFTIKKVEESEGFFYIVFLKEGIYTFREIRVGIF